MEFIEQLNSDVEEEDCGEEVWVTPCMECHEFPEDCHCGCD